MVNIPNTSAAPASPPPLATRAEPETSGVPHRRPALSSELQGLTLQSRPAGAPDAAIAPRSNLPLSPQGAAERPQPAAAIEVSVPQAKREMDRLLEPLADFELMLKHGSPEGLEDRIDASKAVFDYYASLPRQVAVRALPDSRVLHIRDHAMAADNKINELNKPAFDELTAKSEKIDKLLDNLVDANKQRGSGEQIDLSGLYAEVNRFNEAKLQFHDQRAGRADKVLSMMISVTHVLGSSPKEREKEAGGLRMKMGQVTMTRSLALQVAVEFVLFFVASRSLTRQSDDPVRHAFRDAIAELVTFRDDIDPAFKTTTPVVMNTYRMDDSTRTVLDGVIGRLQEFASGVDRATARLRALGAETNASDDPVRLLDKLMERVWVTADDVRRTLLAHVESRDEATPSAGPQRSAPNAAEGSRAPAGRGKGKGKGNAKAKAKAKARAAAEPSKVVGRSALGTKLLVDATPVVASSSSVAPAEPLLQRLARMLEFDLPAHQRQVSRARSEYSPENTGHLVAETIKLLEAKADEMQTCLSEVSKPQFRKQLGGAQMNEVHQQIGQLRTLLAQVKGEARSFKEGMAEAAIEHMKTYAFPTQAHIEQLCQAGQLAPVGQPTPLKSEPCRLFEIKLQPAPLRNATMPSPMWLHLHTQQEVHARQLHELEDADFVACHVKSDVERGRNRQWQNARAREGHENVMIYRGKVEPALCRSLMTL
ncbi:MAG: hypothetical protein JF606_16715 [Burkholderiales bacterium]|nr:hypothetical protein [Burkholderiales bacterium]